MNLLNIPYVRVNVNVHPPTGARTDVLWITACRGFGPKRTDVQSLQWGAQAGL